ncbi:MAG: YtxH domain-containing protein [Nitrospirae bacterium]|nr:YtxH domain-containing protein [Nitrospirota bacterium]
MDEDYKKLAGVFLLGGLIGAVIALLYAPKSGRETRKDISKVARRVKKETSELIDDTIDNIHDFAGSIKDKVSDIIERGVELSESAKKEILKNLEHGQKVIEKQKKRITEAIGL